MSLRTNVRLETQGELIDDLLTVAMSLIVFPVAEVGFITVLRVPDTFAVCLSIVHFTMVCAILSPCFDAFDAYEKVSR